MGTPLLTGGKMLWITGIWLGVLVVTIVIAFALSGTRPWVNMPEGDWKEDQCEVPTSDAFVRQDFNTWSNFGYLYVGLVVLARTKKILPIALGCTMCFMFLGSLAFHASMTQLFQTWDIIGIYWMMGALTLIALVIAFPKLDNPISNSLLLFGVLLASGMMAIARRTVHIGSWKPFDAEVVVPLLMVVLLVFSVIASIRRSKDCTDRGIAFIRLGVAVFLIGFAFVLRQGDGVGNFLCALHSHFLWHIASAVAILFFFDFLGTFDSDLLVFPKPGATGPETCGVDDKHRYRNWCLRNWENLRMSFKPSLISSHFRRSRVVILSRLLLSAASIALSNGVASGQVSTVPLGLNIDINEQAYVDVTSPFARIQSVDGPLNQDEAGWPLCNFQLIIDNRYTFAWVPGATNVDPRHYSTDISGTYLLSFTGQAVLRPDSGVTVSNQAYDPGTNTTTAEINMQNPPGGVLVALAFLQTRRQPTDPPGNGLTNLHMIRPGYAPGSGQIFTDLWLSSIVNYPWSALRFMGVLGTNNYAIPSSGEVYPYLLQWETDRSLPVAGPMYGRSHLGNHGIPSEYVILIANAANSDAWINIPVNASDDYVAQAAALLHAGNAFTGFIGINPNLNIYVEYSNELWHYGFPQGAWNYRAAGDEVEAGGSTLNYDGSTNQDIWRQRRIAKRTMEIGQTFAAAFAENPNRIRPVIDDANIFTPENMLQYINDVYGPPSQFIYGISITGYYGSDDKTSVDAIIAGEQAASDRNVTGYIQNRTIATYWGLHSMVYEGGQDEEGNPRGPGPPVDPNLPNQFAAARDPRMNDVEAHDLIGNWYPSGGELYMQFAHAGRYSTYGMWGLSDDLSNQCSGKWNGMVQTMATPAPSITAGAPVPGVISANVHFWRAPPSRFQQWLVRTDSGGTYDLVINLDTRFAKTLLEVWVNNGLIQSLDIPRDPSSSGQTDLPAVSLSLARGLSVVRLKLISGDTNLNTLTFTAR